MTLPTYYLFYGTFIDLSRKPQSKLQKEQFKHTLVVNRGAVWISPEDGRIKGLEWGLNDLDMFLERMQWEVVIPTPTESESEIEEEGEEEEERVEYTYSGKETVKIFRAKEEENEFFFPGFIGMFVSPV